MLPMDQQHLCQVLGFYFKAVYDKLNIYSTGKLLGNEISQNLKISTHVKIRSPLSYQI